VEGKSMPELPEMENYRLLLNQNISEHVITDIQINRIKSINVSPEDFIKKVKRQKVMSVERRAKHLLFYLDNGLILLLHLMLGGWMYYGTEADKPKRTVQIQLTFGDKHLYFIGLRLGYLHIYDTNGIERELSDLGPEPLNQDFSELLFLQLMSRKRGKLKTKLVDQKFMAGIGNRYSDEICFDARILPTRNINELKKDEPIILYQSIKHVLELAIKNGGYMEHPFSNDDTLTGGYEQLLKVHGREGETCTRCGSNIRMEVISSHKTYFCNECQT
jgi:formamidopyrimidine-DNA glycosylase